ncbi:MAG: glycosyltransferase family 9 protein [candidate division NC10 bacterium]|nr:glycosyltransferase family 9 protein [candidate division NC10 bacterium]
MFADTGRAGPTKTARRQAGVDDLMTPGGTAKIALGVNEPQRILVIKLRYLGDVLISTPVVTSLRAAFPRAHLSMLVNPGTEAMIAHNPHLDEVLVVERSASSLRQLRFVLGLRRRHFDVVIDLTDGDRAAILSRVTGAAIRVGFNREGLWRGRLYTHVVPLQQQPIPMRFKSWPSERFASLIGYVQEKLGMKVVLLWGNQEREIAKAILEQLGSARRSLVGRLGILELAALLRRATLFVGNDNGPMHIAAAMGTAVVGLFGPSDPVVWGPAGQGHAILYKGIDCRPCFPGGCRRGEGNCMRLIGLEEVIALVERLLEQSPRRRESP